MLETRGLTVELPTHAGQVRVRSGQFVEIGPAKEILRQSKNPYTRELLFAVPEFPRA